MEVTLKQIQFAEASKKGEAFMEKMEASKKGEAFMEKMEASKKAS